MKKTIGLSRASQQQGSTPYATRIKQVKFGGASRDFTICNFTPQTIPRICELKKVLVLPGALGDTIVTTPLPRALKRLNPAVQISYVVSEDWLKLFNLPYIDKLISYPAEYSFIHDADKIVSRVTESYAEKPDVVFFPGYQVQLRQQLRQRMADTVFLTNVVDGFGTRPIQANGATVATFYDYLKCDFCFMYEWALAILLPFSDFDPEIFSEDLYSEIAVSGTVNPTLEQIVQQQGARKLIYINVAARDKERNIPLAMLQFILRHFSNPEFFVVVDAFNPDYLDEVTKRQIAQQKGIFIKTWLDETVELIKQADVGIFADSGPSHIAMSRPIDIPMLVLYGSKLYQNTWTHPLTAHRKNPILTLASDNSELNIPLEEIFGTPGLTPASAGINLNRIKKAYPGNINGQELAEKLQLLIHLSGH